jgi:hypothetical protein
MKKIALRGHVSSVESARSEADNCLGPGRSTENRSSVSGVTASLFTLPICLAQWDEV